MREEILSWLCIKKVCNGIVKLISYRSCPSTNCITSLSDLSLVPLDCRMSKYLSKKTLDDFLDGSAALTFAVISCSNCQNNWKLYSSSHIATVATDAEMGLYLENSKTAGGGNLGKTVRRVTRDKNARDKKMTFVHLFCSQMREDST